MSKVGSQIKYFLGLLDSGARMNRNKPFTSGYYSPAGLVLGMGCEMYVSREKTECGEMGQCFYNAQTLAFNEQDRYRYAEGWAVHSKQVSLPLLHTWCINHHGLVVDPTWGPRWKGDIRAYYGVIIKTEYMTERNAETAIFGPLIDDWEGEYKLLTTPGLAKKVVGKCGAV